MAHFKSVYLDRVGDPDSGLGVEPGTAVDHEPLGPGQLVAPGEGLLVSHLGGRGLEWN